MKKPSVLRLLLALLLLGGSLAATLTLSPRLGLDLRGGTSITLETLDGPFAEANAETTDQAVEVLRRRVDALGVSEPTLARTGETRILVELPDVQDAAQARDLVGRTAQLTFHPVTGFGELDPAAPPEPDPALDTTQPQTLVGDQGLPLAIGPATFTGEGVSGAAAQPSDGGIGFDVRIDFDGGGGDAWAALTAAARCDETGALRPDGDPLRQVAIVLDGAVISSPPVSAQVPCAGITGGTTIITGSFDQAEASELATLIEGGSLPVPVREINVSTVGPTLGDEAIEASVQAGIIGVALTGLFLVVVYRLVGALAAIALTTYGLISYAALLLLGATLTLPGLAGLLLSAGLAIDANVLVFERAREEYAKKPRLDTGLRTAYSKALTAISDSAVTTLLAAALLFVLASGPVRGFGVTLVIGTLASLLSALVVTRALTDIAAVNRFVVKRPGVTGVSTLGRVRVWLQKKDPDLMKHRNRWLAASGIALVLAVSGIVVNGLNFGVEFTGGRLLEYSSAQTVDVDRAREAVAEVGFPEAVVQRSGQDDLSVRISTITDEEAQAIGDAVAALGGETERLRDETVGPTLGQELRDRALIAIALALAAQLIYLAVRFRWTFATGAVLAMLHDVLIVIGVFAWLGKPIDGVFLAATLTIIGVSVNDSIVTLDRIREIWTANRTMPLPRVANSAILQTAPRTVNTGIGAMFILAALAILGGSSLQDFALALLLGLIVGTYSSAFTATPLLLALETRVQSTAPMPKKQAPSSRAGREPVRGSGAVV